MSTVTTAAPQPKQRTTWWPWVFVVPALVAFLIFDYYPFLRAFVLSFQATDLFGRPSGWAGLDNYANMFSSGEFWGTLNWTLLYTLGSVLIKIVLGLAIAIPLSYRLRGHAIMRSAVLVPMAVSTAVGTLIFHQMFTPEVGFFDQLTTAMGIGSVNWLINDTTARIAVLMVDGWAGISFVVLLMLASIDNIPDSIGEAASLDGCTGFRYIRHMLIPQISPMLIFLTVTQSVAALKEFTVINALTEGGPAGSTPTLVVDVYDMAFGNSTNDYSAAAATGMVLATLIIILTILQFRLSTKRVTY